MKQAEKSIDFSDKEDSDRFTGMVLPVTRLWHQLSDNEMEAAKVCGARPPGTKDPRTGAKHKYAWDYLRSMEQFLPCFDLFWSESDANFKQGGEKKYLSDEEKKALRTLRIKKDFFCTSSKRGRKPR